METRTSVKDEPLPLRIVKGFAEIYPDCYSVCDDFVRESKDEMSWWDMVDIPIGATIGIMQETYGLHSLGEIANKGLRFRLSIPGADTRKSFPSIRTSAPYFWKNPDMVVIVIFLSIPFSSSLITAFMWTASLRLRGCMCAVFSYPMMMTSG